MKTHLKEILLLILMFFIAWNGFANPNNEPCLTVSRVKLVVIGEDVNHDKTGEGDPHWIKMYRDYLKSFNPDNEIINLTSPTVNSYGIVPTGSSSPYKRPQSDPQHNITKALELSPDAIIVNLEYNDILNEFQLNEQIVNIMLVASAECCINT